jgi:4-hydroxy-4-methyl-2-oxoglutarate aldolase
MTSSELSGAERQELAKLGVATVYEASGREGLIDLELHRIVPGSRVAGPARTVLCAQGDNLMVHAVMALAQPGEVLVIVMPEPEAVGLVGELLATQALGRGVAGMLIDAAVRDREELCNLGLPIWSRFVRVRGAKRMVQGSLGQPVALGGAIIRNGDLIVMDADGAVVVPTERIGSVLEAARVREQRERELRSRFEARELSIDVYGLRGDLEDLLR